jgi:diguanylate cyclase (GGDEF)-like protein
MSGVLASQLALGLLVGITTGILVFQLRQQALATAGHEVQSLALTLADQADRAFEAVDLVQTTFLELAQADDIKTPEDFRSRMSSPEISKQLIAHGEALPQLDALALVDSDGLFINYNHLGPLPANSIADRPYFMALQADPKLASVISDPILNRWDHSWAVVTAHRVTSAEGRFLGISFAGVRMDYFEKLYKTVITNEDTAISLIRNDGVLLARYPHVEAGIGQPSGRRGITAHLAATGADAELVLQASPVDGMQRLIAGHRLSHYPLVVAVSVTSSSILAPWRKQTGFLIGAAVILELVVVGVGMLMQRQLRDQRLLAETRRAVMQAESARRGAEAELALGQERERADRELRTQAVRFSAALGKMSEVLCLFDAEDHLVLGNARLSAMLELPAGSITPGMTIKEMGALLASDQPAEPTDAQRIHRLIMHLRDAGRAQSQAQDMADNRRVAVNFAPMDDGGWLVTLEDISQQRQSESRIAHLAQHDALTGLANRLLFHSRLGEAMARCRRGERCAVLYLDLDHFKAVNDTLGHPTGDALLREVTGRLQRQVRTTDTVARLGGDEFAIVQAIEEPTDSTALARRLLDAVSAPYDIGGNRIIIGLSIGIALGPDDGNDADEIMKNADMALYRSKAEGRGRYHFFKPEMQARMQARRTLDLDMRKALAEGEFRVFYQPQVTIPTRAICGFEALVRWRHPQRGMISPAEFIPLAEENGLVIPLGKFVLRQACADAATWPGNLTVAVNLSPVQFGSPSLVEDVAAALADAGLHASRLELEITETAMLADTDAVLVTLHLLRNLGVSIALDDFGTGFSSLSYLQRFPFNKVKIDRSFVAKLGEDSDNDAIVAAVIGLCGQLAMVTTGEGVETEAQFQCLASLRCMEAQGYLFSRPRPASEVMEMLRSLAPQELITID